MKIKVFKITFDDMYHNFFVGILLPLNFITNSYCPVLCQYFMSRLGHQSVLMIRYENWKKNPFYATSFLLLKNDVENKSLIASVIIVAFKL